MSRSLARAALVVAALVPLVPARAHAGACARPSIATLPLTPANTEIGQGGGVVLTMENSAKAPKWTFVGKKRSPATIKVIGPGLALYSPPAGGEWSLEDDKGKGVFKATFATAPAKVLPAPKLNAIRYAQYTGRRGTSTYVTADIAGAPPPGAIALLVLDDKGAVTSWGRVTNIVSDPASKSTNVQTFASGSCTVVPNGMQASMIGSKVKVAWLDASGQQSATTAATVAETPDELSRQQIR